MRDSPPVSRRNALRYATAVSALAGFGAASAGVGMPTASAAAPTLIDYAMRQIPAQDIRAAGHAGVINYVSTSRPGSSFGAKPITLPYAKSLTASGLVLRRGCRRRSHRVAATHRCRWRPERADLLQRR